MKLTSVAIHNFRSIKDLSICLNPYSLLIGPNNSGKTNIIDALRMFYEKDLKFVQNRDFPKFAVDDQEAWIELTYILPNEEFSELKDEYKQPSNSLRVRKYLKSSDPERVKANQANIFAYENGVLSGNLFYGARNISAAKLGDILYVPEVAKVDDYTKLSGPSSFRDSLNFVISKVIKNSPSFESLADSFSQFNKDFRKEESKDGFSLTRLIADVNTLIQDWDVSFDIEITDMKPDVIIKNLVRHHLRDAALDDERMEVASFGQGLQRHLIYSLIKISVDYSDNPMSKDKKEFSPEFTLILFEEPEAFLHPEQQNILNTSLKELASEETIQVLASSHSSNFVSRNIEELTSIVKLAKFGPCSRAFQIDRETLGKILDENMDIDRILQADELSEDAVCESLRYSLWFDPDRCCSLFAQKVLICEGLSEKALVDCLVEEKPDEFPGQRLYVINAAGKFNIPRYMNLFGRLGIEHACLFDIDSNKPVLLAVNDLIERSRNPFTLGLYALDGGDGDFEGFLGIPKPKVQSMKPLSVMWHYKNNKIDEMKITRLIGLITALLDENPVLLDSL